MKALVTGATGYIGSKLCQQLLVEGWEVDVLVRPSGRRLPESLAGKVSLRTHDGSTESVLGSVAESKPDVVFHLASLFIAEHCTEQVTDLINSNVLFGTQLIEACARAGVKRFINTGTSWQHYRSGAYDPVCLYAATKQAFEDILDFYADAFGISAVTLKLFDTYGPADPRSKIVRLLFRAAISGDRLEMSPGDQWLDFVHIEDVVAAFMHCQVLLEGQTQPHQRYALPSAQRIRLKGLVELIGNVTGRPLNIEFGGRPYRAREVMESPDIAPLPQGWQPRISLEEGLLALWCGEYAGDGS